MFSEQWSPIKVSDEKSPNQGYKNNTSLLNIMAG